MRIISGKFRGKKLKEFNISSTRPSTDRVKEAIFNLIQFNVMGASVLDLFSGTGALGIEAISRNANDVTMIDNNDDAIKLIQLNLKSINCDFDFSEQKTSNKSVKLIKADAINFLRTCNQKYDIIILDPPYKTNLGVEAINIIVQRGIIEKNGIIIFETDKEHEFNFQNPNYEITKKTYGIVGVYKIVRLN